MKKYALAGCSGRALGTFAQKIQENFPDKGKIVGMFDPNHKKFEYYNSQLREHVPGYTDFKKMLMEQKPDSVIITTIDSMHHKYIIEALEAGCDAIVEKPMTIDEKKCAAILKAEKKTGKNVYVTFNCRHQPYCTRVKELITEGKVGKILSIHFEWHLGTIHGASYFRRWHRRKENSGGLLVHKATHHFDIANWFLEEDPVAVQAFGDRRVYGSTRKERGDRCLTCKHKNTCEFYWDIEAQGEKIKGLYINAESVDNYYRDGCVFSPDIDIEDTMSVNVKYSDGAFMTYSLIAHSPYEAWKMSINGTGGRLEIGKSSSGNGTFDNFNYIDYYDRKEGKITYEIPKAREGHGGGDARLQRMLFVGDLQDPLGVMAGTKAGAMSILIGVAANKSIKTGSPVDVKKLLPDEFRKKYYPASSHSSHSFT